MATRTCECEQLVPRLLRLAADMAGEVAGDLRLAADMAGDAADLAGDAADLAGDAADMAGDVGDSGDASSAARGAAAGLPLLRVLLCAGRRVAGAGEAWMVQGGDIGGFGGG